MTEQTKIVPVTCRDCGRTMTVLALASAKIIEGRCPACTESFENTGEEWNRSIGYEKNGKGDLVYVKGKIGNLNMNTLANNGSFGLEYLLWGEQTEKVVNLIRQGIEFCERIDETEESKTIKNSLQKVTNEMRSRNNEQIMSGHESPFSELETRRMQHFFNEAGRIYLKRAIIENRRRNRW